MCEILLPLHHKGKMAEWSKAHAWKACVPQKGIKGSNPFLSARLNYNATYAMGVPRSFSSFETGTAVVIGAGPAGMTAARELQRQTSLNPVVIEQDETVGGLSKTMLHHGNRMDIGGHRFFSKDQRINDWWEHYLPAQSAPAMDDLLTGRRIPFREDGADPEQTDRVMLHRQRISRIYFLRRFFDYPVTFSWSTIRNLGAGRLLQAGWGYLKSTFRPLPETSLENFYINRFGKPLYNWFFASYTEKVWGIHPSRLSAGWGAQRVKGLSIGVVLRNIWEKACRREKDRQAVETSLIEQFSYPKLGPGQLWELVADDVRQQGGRIFLQTQVTGIRLENHRVVSVTLTGKDGSTREQPCDCLISTMPLKELVSVIRGETVPDAVREIADGLPYRDFMAVSICADRLKIKNNTKYKTFMDRIPDTWIYIQEHGVRMGRLQLFNNWSPYMVKDYRNTVWMEAEYFCQEGDSLWNMTDAQCIRMAVKELEEIGFLEPDAVRDACCVRVRKAYPTYAGTYHRMDTLRTWLDGIDNLYCIGRNGQHRYNNMDHSMLTAMACIDAIRSGTPEHRAAIWAVNTEEVYHETRNDRS